MKDIGLVLLVTFVVVVIIVALALALVVLGGRGWRDERHVQQRQPERLLNHAFLDLGNGGGGA